MSRGVERAARELKARMMRTAGMIAGSGVTPFILPNTIHDEFAGYGGFDVEQSGSDALAWLQLHTFTQQPATGGAKGENWLAGEVPSGGALTILNSYYPKPGEVLPVEGLSSFRLDVSFDNESSVHYAAATNSYSAPLDLTADGRFGNDDYICIAVHVAAQGHVIDTLEIRLYSDLGGNKYYGAVLASNYTATAHWSFFAVKKSAFTAVNAPDWASIAYIRVMAARDTNGAAEHTLVTWDDLRIVKADPTDASTFNDTYDQWYFFDGVWHIYQDVSNVPYAMGQVYEEVPGTRCVAVKRGNYNIEHSFAAGVQLRGPGLAGIVWGDGPDDCYELVINQSLGRVLLYKSVDGAQSTLATIFNFTFSVFAKYTLGMIRSGVYLYCYLSTLPDVFHSNNLLCRISDSSYTGGQVGFVSYGVNSRFFDLRAGSPEHALVAEHAINSDYLGGMPASLFIARRFGGF